MLVVHDRNKTQRSYFGESAAEPLLRWLNVTTVGGHGAQARARVEELIVSIRNLQESARDGSKRQPSRKFIAQQTKVNVSLGNYQLIQRVDCTCPPALEWTLVGDHDLSRDFIPGEASAVVLIVELAKLDRLERIRKCDCGRYFFARLPAQRFHDNECRERFWESSPDRQQRRREKAREYYYLHKSGKVR
jgi:hypothetical protein